MPVTSRFSAKPGPLWSVGAEAVIAVGSMRTRLQYAFLSPMSGPHFKAAPTLATPSLDARKSRLLFFFNLLALLTTLMLAWILYSQIVVIRHYRR